jgi:hypothetical protein
MPDAVLAKASMALEPRTDDELREDAEVLRRSVASGVELLSRSF